jgi:hypothetical protein
MRRRRRPHKACKLRAAHLLLGVTCLSLGLLGCNLRTVLLSTTTTTTTTVQQQQQHAPGSQYSLSFRRPNGKWKNPLKKVNHISAADLADLPLLPSGRDSAATTTTSTTGKEFVLDLLQAAGITKVDASIREALPTWERFASLYGNDTAPVVVGRDTCRDATERRPAVAGLFNTGTTALAVYLRENILSATNTNTNTNTNHKDTAVPWGKHRLWSLRHAFWPPAARATNDTATTSALHDHAHDKILPIVIVRDPFSWMQSMCTSPYKASWPHAAAHCPNLVAHAADVALAASPQPPQPPVHLGDPIPVVLVAQQQRRFRSLLHLWVEWYTEYVDAAFTHEPCLLVRFEDMLIRPDAVVAAIRTCFLPQGLHTAAPPPAAASVAFTYVVAPVKWDQAYLKPQSGMVSALIKYGNGYDRLTNLTAADVAFARQVLAPGTPGGRLMALFHYSLPWDVAEG